jgi:hypothetical protein
MSAENEIHSAITLELREALHDRVDRNRLTRVLRDAAGEELDRLGVPGVPKLRMPVGDGSRAVCVRLNGSLAPYPPELLTRVWQGVAPRELQLVALGEERIGRFPDAWLDQVVDASLLADVLAGLTVALIRRRPDALLSIKALAAYVTEIEAVLPETKEHDIEWDTILRPLIRLTGTLADRRAVGSAVLGAIQMGLTGDDVIESAFASLRDGHVGVLWNSGLADWSADATADLDRRLLDAFGLPVPEIRVVEGVGADTSRIEVVTAGVPGVAAAMIGRDELLVDAPEVDGIEGTTIMHPVTGARAVVVPAEAQARVENAGLAVVDAKRLAIELVARELQEHRRRLVSLSELEHQLALLRARVPAVVGAAVAMFPLSDLTRIARLLVEEDISMRDLKGSLDRLLDYEAMRPRRPAALSEPPNARTNGGSSHTPRADDYAEAVRAAHAHSVAPVSVIEVDPALEARLASARERGRAAEVLAAGIRDAAWSVLRDDEKPVVVTSPESRRALRAALVDELPTLQVLSRPDLAPDEDRRVVGKIEL